jgi:hypothetical protein
LWPELVASVGLDPEVIIDQESDADRIIDAIPDFIGGKS